MSTIQHGKNYKKYSLFIYLHLFEYIIMNFKIHFPTNYNSLKKLDFTFYKQMCDFFLTIFIN